MSNLFIDVEVTPEAASDPALAAKLAEVCPVDIYATGEDGSLRVVEREPRRVRALPAVHRRRAARHGARCASSTTGARRC